MTNQTIFISHRTTDKAVADMLLDFLATTGIPRDAIKCSSLPGNDVKQQISPEVRTWIAGSAVNIAILSRDYYKSAYCLNEAGILWYLKDVPVIPIALPEIKHADMIGFLNSDYKLRRLDSEDDIAYIYDTVQEKLEAKQARHSVINTETKKLKERYRAFCNDRLSAVSDSVVKAGAGKSRVESDVESAGGESKSGLTDDYERWLEEEDLYVDGYHEVHDRDGNVVEKGQYLKGKLVDGISCNIILKISREKEGVEEREPTAEEAEDFDGYDYEAWKIKQMEEPVPPDEIKDEQWSYYECQRYEAPLMLSQTNQYIASLGIEYFYVVDKKVKLDGKQIKPTFMNFRTLESFLQEHEPDGLEYLKTGKWGYEQADSAEVEV